MTHTEIAPVMPAILVALRKGLRRLLQECLTFVLHLNTITTRLNLRQYRKQTLSEGLP